MDVIHLIRSVWKQRLFIAVFACVPALVYGSWIFFTPRSHGVTLSYPIELTATDFQRLTNRFYGGENLKILIAAMEAEGLKDLPEALRLAESETELHKLIDLQVTPNYVDFNQRQNLKLSLDRSWAENVEKIEQLRARLLQIQLNGGSAEETSKALKCVRINFEKHLPLRELQDGLLQRRYALNNQLVANEQDSAYRAEELEAARNTLENLRTVDPGKGQGPSPAVNLDLSDPAKVSNYLPLSLQREIYAAQVAVLSEKINIATRTYRLKFSEGEILAKVSQALDEEIGKGAHLETYLAFLKNLGQTQQGSAADLVSGLYHLAENYDFSRRPLVAEPRIVPQARHTIQRTLFTAVLLGMLATLIQALRFWLATAEN